MDIRPTFGSCCFSLWQVATRLVGVQEPYELCLQEGEVVGERCPDAVEIDVERAVDGSILWQLSFWDALIIVAARKARCNILYTEDLTEGQTIDGIKIRDPFRAL